MKESLPVGGGSAAPRLPGRARPGGAAAGEAAARGDAEWGQEVLDALPSMLPDPAFDLLRRVPPRGPIVPVQEDDTVSAVVATLLGLDRSYLAIQGPPGTGKTNVGSNVVARLVREHGWRVGVVGQSHATSENFLSSVVKAGVPADRVVKVPKSGATEDELEAADWTPVKNNAAVTAFLLSCAETGTGGVVGGTAWTFANETTIERRSLDLLVVDEAGQFSLAPTIASSVAATRLLLLGDPQQLPQVSQGSHPEPVDVSALGWLTDGEHVLPAEYGYFLARTRRMEPALTASVSSLSYDGQLSSMASGRHLDGIDAGVHPVPVVHAGNTTSSEDEAARVVALARAVIGRSWTDDSGTRTLTDEDVIVVAPYNAQGALIRRNSTAPASPGTQVGTVDMFQGREAVVSIVSLAASSAADIPRGLDFLLMPNRLNVALSRAKWAAYLVYSPALTTGLPPSIAGLSLLSRFIELVEPEREGTFRPVGDGPGSRSSGFVRRDRQQRPGGSMPGRLRSGRSGDDRHPGADHPSTPLSRSADTTEPSRASRPSSVVRDVRSVLRRLPTVDRHNGGIDVGRVVRQQERDHRGDLRCLAVPLRRIDLDELLRRRPRVGGLSCRIEFSTIGVQIAPGAIALMRMPYCPYSTAELR